MQWWKEVETDVGGPGVAGKVIYSRRKKERTKQKAEIGRKFVLVTERYTE